MKKIIYSLLIFGALSNFCNVYGDEVVGAPAKVRPQSGVESKFVQHVDKGNAVRTDTKQNTNVAASKTVPGGYQQLGNSAINENQKRGQSEASKVPYQTTNYDYPYYNNQQPAYGYQQQYPNQGYEYAYDPYRLFEHLLFIEQQNEKLINNTDYLVQQFYKKGKYK